jgi:hypothetical protein
MMCNDFSVEGVLGAYNPQWGLPSGPEEWMWAWIATGGILLVSLAIVIVLRRRRMRRKAEAAAHVAPGRVATGPKLAPIVAEAIMVTSASWPELAEHTIGWATQATVLEPAGTAWRESGEAVGLAGPPDVGVFDVPTTAHPVLGLALAFSPTDKPVREIAIVGERAGAVLVGAILHASTGNDLEWKATRALDATREIVRITFPHAILARNVTIILRPRESARIAGVALVGD